VGGRDIRLAELVCSISLATDLGTGQPMEHALRTCVLSQRAGEALGLDAHELRELCYVSLLRFLGCTSGAAKDAELAGGGEIDFYAGFGGDALQRIHRAALVHDLGRVGSRTRSGTGAARSRPTTGSASGSTPT